MFGSKGLQAPASGTIQWGHSSGSVYIHLRPVYVAAIMRLALPQAFSSAPPMDLPPVIKTLRGHKPTEHVREGSISTKENVDEQRIVQLQGGRHTRSMVSANKKRRSDL